MAHFLLHLTPTSSGSAFGTQMLHVLLCPVSPCLLISVCQSIQELCSAILSSLPASFFLLWTTFPVYKTLIQLESMEDLTADLPPTNKGPPITHLLLRRVFPTNEMDLFCQSSGRDGDTSWFLRCHTGPIQFERCSLRPDTCQASKEGPVVLPPTPQGPMFHSGPLHSQNIRGRELGNPSCPGLMKVEASREPKMEKG